MLLRGDRLQYIVRCIGLTVLDDVLVELSAPPSPRLWGAWALWALVASATGAWGDRAQTQSHKIHWLSRRKCARRWTKIRRKTCGARVVECKFARLLDRVFHG